MTTLIWDEGMSVGIEAIDDDHKQIITILAKLTSTKHGKVSTQEIEDIFTELNDYVIGHFVREEALLEEAFYSELEEHKKSHQIFIETLPQLKNQWLTQDNITTSENITTFLHQWIVNHILVEDLDYVPTLHNHANKETTNHQHSTDEQAAEFVKNKLSIPSRISLAFARKVKLSQRVFITTLIPVFVVLAFGYAILLNNYQRYENMELLLGLNNIIEQVNEISHSLQAERGLSSGLTSSNYQQFSQQLAKRRMLTDKAISSFYNILDNELAPAVKNNIQHYLNDTHNYFSPLTEHRQQVDGMNVNFRQTYHAYTVLIEQLLSVSENLIHVDMNSTLASDISAISAVLLFKEYMGQIRALGMNAVNAQGNDLYNNIEISRLVGKQLNALRVFQYSANKEQKLLCADYCNVTLHQQLLERTFSRLKQAKMVQQKKEFWFDLMSAEIDSLKNITDKLNQKFTIKVQGEIQQLESFYLSILAALGAFLFFATLFSIILNDSIISPVRRVTSALNNMAKGQYNVQFKNTVANDEIGAMQAAYEKLRRRILQARIFQVIVNKQKNEIEYRKTQQTHLENLALTDALTGAVNRHQFNLVLDEEISKADNQQRSLSVLLLDIDHFKEVNDSFGHGVGDEVLVAFYLACKASVRSTDVIARIGGEEFVIILPNTNSEHAYQFAERLRVKIEDLKVVVEEKTIDLTVSIGVSQWQSELFDSAQEFIANADKLLYQAKKEGRNKVVVAK